MVHRDPTRSRSRAGAIARRSADRLALALEDVGFDVGQEYPALRGGVDTDGAPVVELGSVTAGVADSLSSLLRQVHGKMSAEDAPTGAKLSERHSGPGPHLS